MNLSSADEENEQPLRKSPSMYNMNEEDLAQEEISENQPEVRVSQPARRRR